MGAADAHARFESALEALLSFVRDNPRAIESPAYLPLRREFEAAERAYRAMRLSELDPPDS